MFFFEAGLTWTDSLGVHNIILSRDWLNFSFDQSNGFSSKVVVSPYLPTYLGRQLSLSLTHNFFLNELE